MNREEMGRKDDDDTGPGAGHGTHHDASEASAGTMESLRSALLGIVPRIKEAVAWDEDAEYFTEAAERMGKAQFVYWWDTPDSVTDTVLDPEDLGDLDDSVRQAFLPDDWESFSDAAVSLNEDYDLLDGYRGTLNRCIDAFCYDMYGSACAGLCTIFDGLLSDLRETFGEGLGERLGAFVDLMEEDADGQGYYDSDQIDTLMFLTSLAGAMDSFGEGADFARREPETLNRQWITHGRGDGERAMLDCLKLLRMVNALLILEDMLEDDVKVDEDDDG